MSAQFKNMRYEAGQKPAFLQRMIAGEQSKERPTVIGKTERDEDAPEEADEAPLVVDINGEEVKEQESEAGSSSATAQEQLQHNMPSKDKASAKDKPVPGAGLSFGSGPSTKRKQFAVAQEEGSEVVRRGDSKNEQPDSSETSSRKKKKKKTQKPVKLSFQ